MSDHMTQVNNALKELSSGKVKQYIFITSPNLAAEQIDRAYGTLSSMGYATLASRTLGAVTLGSNEKFDGKGFRITYLGLTEVDYVIERLRGQQAHIIVLEEADIGRVLNIADRNRLGQEIAIINSRYEIQWG